MGKDGSFQLKSWNPEHVCGWQEKNTKVTSLWLAEKYLQVYRDDPLWRLKGFVRTVRREYMIEITYNQAWRARLRALMMTHGFAPEQYAQIWDYAAAVLKWNPGSSVFVKPESLMVGGPEMPMRFQRFYVCLNACKQGFLKGCRPIIGLDGCHLKGVYKGQVLTAVSMDGNENIFPLAYAVVESETKETWCWFLEILVNDLGTQNVTFMSDRQKGLIEALSLVAPSADTRVCVRHMLNNFKVQWPGKAFKDAVWAAAYASTTSKFEETMNVIKDMDEKAYKYLMNQHPSTWSLHAFKYYTKSNMQLNNACESFNSCILEGREMPILSMCEWIRRKLMKMFISKRKKMQAHKGVLTPGALERCEKAKIEALQRTRCIGDGDLFEVDCGPSRFVVDLHKKTCGCNIWDITGIPCLHAMCCIMKKRLKVEPFVSPYYYKETCLKAYELSVPPMPGKEEWDKTNQPPLQPPRLIIQPGRPKGKARRKEPGEEDKSKKQRVRFGKNKCGNCGEEGHTRKICKNPPKAPESNANKKPGRPTSETGMPFIPQKRRYSKRKEKTAQCEVGEGSVSVDQGTFEDDPQMQELIEQAMVQYESQIPTQQSQTEVTVGMSSNAIQSQGNQASKPPLPRSSRTKSLGIRKSPIKRQRRSYGGKSG